MTPFWDWEVPLMLWLQQGHPAWTPFFRFLTLIGNEEFSLLAGPLVLWCINKAWGIGLLVALLGSQGVNVAIKELLRVPRPFLTQGRILQLDDPGGWSLPSGHAQNSTVIWMYMASQVRRVWFWVLAALLVLGISLSRPYLGVHYPGDVIVGIAVGLAFLGVLLAATPSVTAWVARRRSNLWLIGLAALGVLLCILQPYSDFVAAVATLCCGIIGVMMERARVRFEVGGALQQRALRYVVGVIVLFLLWRGLKMVFGLFTDEGTTLYLILRGIRYGLLGLWVTWGAPALFVRLRLASQTAA